MISFGLMTVLLVTMACVVHYDLLGLFLAYPYGRYSYTTVGEPQHQHEHQPVVDFNGMWVPKPGTDPNVRYPGPKMDGLMHDLNLDFDLDLGFDDDDDFWSEVTDPDDDDAGNGGERADRATCSAGAKAAADDDTAGEDTGTCSAGGGGGVGGGSGYPHPGPSFPTVDLPPTRDDRVDEDQNANDHGDDNDFDDFDFDDDDDGFVATGEEYDDDVF